MYFFHFFFSEKCTMAPVTMKACLRLNELLSQALSKQMDSSPEQVNEVLLQTKSVLTDVLKGLSVNTNTQLFLDIQGLVLEIMLKGLNKRRANEILQLNVRVSGALENQFKKGDVDTLIKVNMDISYILIERSEDKLTSLLKVISEGMAHWEKNVYVKPFFLLNKGLSQVLDLQCKEERLDFISKLNRVLAEIMSVDYPDGSVFRLVRLNHITCIAIMDKCENQEHLYMANLLLAEHLRKTWRTPLDEDLLYLNSNLVRLFVQQNSNANFRKLIEWKLQLSNVMQKMHVYNGETGEASGQENGNQETSLRNAETSGGMERPSTMSGVLKKPIPEDVMLDVGENANFVEGTASESGLQYHYVHVRDLEEPVNEQMAVVPTEGEGTVDAEDQSLLSSSAEERRRVRGSKPKKVPEKMSRSKRDFMTKMHLPPVTIGQRRTEKVKNPR